jgi:peptidoglycan hydrolase-like protein with peptidoglycan-binding domain
MKIIKLTEYDLENIVKKVLKEQNTINSFVTPALFQNINTKNLKIGDGGRNSPEKRNDVIALQQILINSGNLKTKTGKPTGYFGNLTNAALNRYNQSKSSAKRLNTKLTNSSEKETSFTDDVKNFCLNTKGKIKALANTFDVDKIMTYPLPPHMRAFLTFLEGRTTPIQASFFKPEELKVIEDRVNSYFPKNQKCISNKSCNVPFYTNETDWSKVKSGQAKVVNPKLATAIGYTIGNGQVIDNGNSYIIKDIYDFNNYQKNPEAYSLKNAGSTAADAINKILCGNYIQGIEELVSFKQALGYKGIPVEIEVPKRT